MKTVGIIGGVGPDTTAKVYLELIRYFRLAGESRYPSITIHNMPFSFKLEHEAVIKNIHLEKMLPHLLSAAKILEKSGATFGILPCNTLHKFIEEIRKEVTIPFLNILEETAFFIKNLNIHKVGILGTNTTMKEKLYEDAFVKQKISFFYPNKIEQKYLSQLIKDLLDGNQNEKHKNQMRTLTAALHTRGAEAILLGCTDLQMVADKINRGIPIIDSTEILIRATLRELTKKQR